MTSLKFAADLTVMDKLSSELSHFHIYTQKKHQNKTITEEENLYLGKGKCAHRPKCMFKIFSF